MKTHTPSVSAYRLAEQNDGGGHEPTEVRANTKDRSRASPGKWLPAVCDFSVTNVCNAACDFCGFARDKTLVGPRQYADPEALERALPILYRRGIRYMTLQGGEPLVHPKIVRIVSLIAASGIKCGLITNGWFLPRYIRDLAEAGLQRLEISIDSADLAEHETNRGLEGLTERLIDGIRQAHAYGLPVVASVTVNRLVRYEQLPQTLEHLGFDAVAFSYPRREPLGSSSLVFDKESHLVDLEPDELLDAIDEIILLKKQFPVFNPKASLAEVARYVRGEPQLVSCIGGYKYFYLDWSLDIWRCEVWDKPLGSVFDFDRIPDQREPCNACMMGCYRNASMLMHAGVAATDALQSLMEGNIGATLTHLFRRSVTQSISALAEEMPRIRRLTRKARRRRTEVAAALPGSA
jgi:MoaA/NifB/PqqE/SkfB family radical SAM enzyme